MNSLIYLFRFLYRIRYWLIICPILVTFIVAMKLKSGSRGHNYSVTTTIYTGVVSGYDIESSEASRQDWNIINNAMDNLMNIITSKATLKNVSMRLYAQNLVHGDAEKDNQYMLAKTYRILLSKTPPDVLALVDRNSEEKTLENLYEYEKAEQGNHVYGLFNYTHRHYSYEALRNITVKRVNSSDMLEVSYSADDPGIAYNTLVILNDEFVKQYKELRFGETNNVIKYFEDELAKTKYMLRSVEDSLTDYNVEKRVINYDEQTKHIAALSRDFELRYESILLEHNSSEKLLKSLENRIEEHIKQLKNNSLFNDKLRAITDLTTKIATIEAFNTDTMSVNPEVSASPLIKERASAEKELAELAAAVSRQNYTKEGVSTSTVLDQWLDALLRNEKSKAELEVMKQRRESLDEQYVFFSPIGSTIKRKEREINITEQSYLSILHGLNSARLKQKSLQMSSATLKIINPPAYPISAMPTKNKLIAIGSFFGTILFVIGFFMLIELLDRTLRDKLRTERITGGKVLGAFPGPGRLRYRSYTKACNEVASKYMGNAILGFISPGKPDIVNIMSMERGEGKSFITEKTAEYLRSSGLAVKVISWHSDFDKNSKEFLLASSVTDFAHGADGQPIHTGDYDIVMVEYPPLKDCTVSKALLENASLNIIITRANRVWKDTDQLLFDTTLKHAGDAPVFIYLNRATREAVQMFTGLLPPYTRIRKFMYKLYQMGFTSSDK